LDAQTNTLVDHIRLTAKKMFNIIEELLLLASVRQQDEIDIYFHEVNMKGVLEDSLFRLEQLLAEEQAEIIVPDNLPTAYGYAPWIEEVWVNYISNGLKYGGHPPRLEITASVHPDFIEYAVIDNGQGIAPDSQARLFTPFVRLHKADIKREGHGLGLSIVQRIIEQLNGEVGMENMDGDGQGARFWFRLPPPPPAS
jgi:signal transduction histidine kinase